MLIKGAMICDANGEYKGDIRIENEKITEGPLFIRERI